MPYTNTDHSHLLADHPRPLLAGRSPQGNVITFPTSRTKTPRTTLSFLYAFYDMKKVMSFYKKNNRKYRELKKEKLTKKNNEPRLHEPIYKTEHILEKTDNYFSCCIFFRYFCRTKINTLKYTE